MLADNANDDVFYEKCSGVAVLEGTNQILELQTILKDR